MPPEPHFEKGFLKK